MVVKMTPWVVVVGTYKVGPAEYSIRTLHAPATAGEGLLEGTPIEQSYRAHRRGTVVTLLAPVDAGAVFSRLPQDDQKIFYPNHTRSDGELLPDSQLPPDLLGPQAGSVVFFERRSGSVAGQGSEGRDNADARPSV